MARPSFRSLLRYLRGAPLPLPVGLPPFVANRIQAVGKPDQLRLWLEYRRRIEAGEPLPGFAEAGFSNFSQFDEDGILHLLFAVIGPGGRRCAEVCAGVGYESVTANLIVNHNWTGLLVDGDPDAAQTARQFFADRAETFWDPPEVVEAWVTRDTINPLLADAGCDGDLDLLVLDLDGVDLHIWEGLTVAMPRVLVVEINDLWPVEVCVTVPYREDFRYREDRPGYCGASLGAWVKSARRRGYRLVGSNRNAMNCFFLREDQPDAARFPEVDPATILDRPSIRRKQARYRDRIAGYDWESV